MTEYEEMVIKLLERIDLKLDTLAGVVATSALKATGTNMTTKEFLEDTEGVIRLLKNNVLL